MVQINFKKPENQNPDSFDIAIKNKSPIEILTLMREHKHICMYVISNKTYAGIVYDKITKRTYGHEAVRLNIMSASFAMSHPDIWQISDGNGWTIGHEAVKNHRLIAINCLESNNNSLLTQSNNNGESIGKIIHELYRLSLSKSQDEILRSVINLNKSYTDSKKISKNVLSNQSTSILSSSEVTSTKAFDVEELKTSARKNITEKSSFSDKKDMELTVLNLIKNGSIAQLQKMLNEDNLFANYLISNKVALNAKITKEGHTLAHYLASINEDYAIMLISDPDIAQLVTTEKRWSVAHEAVAHHLRAARFAMNSFNTPNNLWELFDYKGRSVGHTAVKYNSDIAILAINSKDAKKLLLVDDDNENTIAHVGVKWSEFASMVLENPELYSVTNQEGIMVGMEAVRLHFSSARKILDHQNKYTKELGFIEGAKLINLAKNKLSKI